ncbi:MAG: hypothetical protein LBH00_09595 [Planctomycetaceae bacterium]|nr:hypothetical protein [Planctomycetaceae bacterium]
MPNNSIKTEIELASVAHLPNTKYVHIPAAGHNGPVIAVRKKTSRLRTSTEWIPMMIEFEKTAFLNSFLIFIFRNLLKTDDGEYDRLEPAFFR